MHMQKGTNHAAEVDFLHTWHMVIGLTRLILFYPYSKKQTLMSKSPTKAEYRAIVFIVVSSNGCAFSWMGLLILSLLAHHFMGTILVQLVLLLIQCFLEERKALKFIVT